MQCVDCEYKNTIEAVDGNEYINCKFNNCVIVYSGGPLPVLRDCSFHHCNWRFDAAAHRTLQYMSQLYNAGGKPFIEECFDHIRLGL
jgi:hypothetical protein